MTSVVAVRGLALEVPGGRKLFSNIDFSLDRKLTALVGRNGVGKTCLAKVLVGELRPSHGTVERLGSISFLRQRQEPPDVRVDAFLDPEAAWSRLREDLLAGIDQTLPCTALSGGAWMRVRLAQALGDGFVILDEPTNDLDREGREAVLRFLRGHRGGALLVSHDRECLALCEKVLELSNLGLTTYGGSWEAYEHAKEQEQKAALRALTLAKHRREAAKADRMAQLARQERRNRRGAANAAKGGMPKILLGARKRQAQESTGRVDAASADGLDAAVREAHEALAEKKIEPVMYAEIQGRPLPAQRLIVEACGFNVRFRDWLYRSDLTFAWRGNARVALKGGNGSGKSTLLKAIAGQALHTRGTLRRGELATLYLDQTCSCLDDDKSVLQNVQEASCLSESEVRNALARFLFAKTNVFQKVRALSGGERLRAALARGLLTANKPELLLLDEPTNNLDLANIAFLEAVVRSFRGALVVVSHDEVFLNNCDVTSELRLCGVL